MEKPQERSQRDAGANLLDGAQDPQLVAPIGQSLP
jgi:hypothetical protein